MTKEYKNPPVVEAWIEFHFEYGEEAPKWDQNVAVQFVTSVGEQFNHPEHALLFRKDVRFNASNGSFEFAQSAPVFEKIKTFNVNKDRCIQVDRNLLVYNMLRKGLEWPGFEVLMSEIMPIQKKYLQSFHPVRIGRIVLHYRDNIIIPFDKNGKIEPKDYFEIYPNIPPQIGDMANFSLSLTLPTICRNGDLQFSIKTMPCITNGEQKKMSFIIDWNVYSNALFECTNEEEFMAWLNNAHKGLNGAFENCLTEKCRALFL